MSLRFCVIRNWWVFIPGSAPPCVPLIFSSLTEFSRFRKSRTSRSISGFFRMPLIRGSTGGGRPIVRVALLPFLPDQSPVGSGGNSYSLEMLECRALLDTGADGTSVCRSAALTAGLRYYGKRPVVGVGGLAHHRTWATYLGFFPNYSEQGPTSLVVPSGAPHVLAEPHFAIEIQDNLGFEVIIGRDILSLGNFTMRRGGSFEFELPDSD